LHEVEVEQVGEGEHGGLQSCARCADGAGGASVEPQRDASEGGRAPHVPCFSFLFTATQWL